MPTVRIELPFHLCTLARTPGGIELEVAAPVTQRAIINAIESKFPMLRGTIRDHVSQKRRPMVRFFACNRDLSNDPADAPVPEEVASGREAYLIIGAIAGG